MSLQVAQLSRTQELIRGGLEFLLGERAGAKAAWGWLRSCKDLVESMDADALEKVNAVLGWEDWAGMLVREKLGVNLSRETIQSVVDALDSLFVERVGKSIKRAMLCAIAAGLSDSGSEFIVGKHRSSEDAWAWLQVCALLFDAAGDPGRSAEVREHLTLEELAAMKSRSLFGSAPPKDPITRVVRLLDELCQPSAGSDARRRR